jgi:tetratricopeptide (TPR) repeat protein
VATLRLRCGISTKRYASSPRIVAFGQIRRNAGDFKDARADFDEAIRLCPVDPGNYYERALVLKRLGRRAEAIRDREMYLDRDRTHGCRDHHEEQHPQTLLRDLKRKR